MKLEPDLRDEFMAEPQALDRPASQVVRNPMRESVFRPRNARECGAFVRLKVGSHARTCAPAVVARTPTSRPTSLHAAACRRGALCDSAA
jgi:hypothetical protein